MSLSLTQEELNRCDVPGCEHDNDLRLLQPACHPSLPVHAEYDPQNGSITLRCASCRRVVCEVAVAADRKMTAVRSRMASRT